MRFHHSPSFFRGWMLATGLIVAGWVIGSTVAAPGGGGAGGGAVGGGAGGENAISPAQRALLDSGQSILSTKFESLSLIGKRAATDANASLVSNVQGEPFERAWRATVSRKPPEEQDIVLEGGISAPLKAGQTVWIGLWARTLETQDDTGQGWVGVVLEQKAEPYDKIASYRYGVGSQWQRIMLPATVKRDFAANSLHLAIRLGAAQQTIEIGPVQVLLMPESVKPSDLPATPVTYAGRDSGAPWRAAADASIEKIRKGDFTIRVVDASGKPIAGATIDVRLARHAFDFGCVYKANYVAGEQSTTPQGRAYQELFASLFNIGVDENGLKWPRWEEPATRDAALRSIDWMHAHGIAVRGHCLVWPAWKFLPKDIPNLKDDRTALARRIDDHIRQEATALRGKLVEWDVVNEPNSKNDLLKILGEEVMAHWYKLARECDPSARLYLNEASVPNTPSTEQRYTNLYNRIVALQNAGAPIGGVGMQAHFGSRLLPLADLQRIYDRFAGLGVPTKITELDIAVDDEQLQADYLRDFMILSFAHPNIDGILMWSFWDSAGTDNKALWRKDFTIKPAGQAWKDLVQQRWTTTAKLTTQPDGRATVRGFLGDYELRASSGGQSTTITAPLRKTGSTIDIELK